MPELLDIYDENLVKIGVKERSAVHHDGDWHKTFHCWICYRGEDGRDYLVMQKRSATKDTFPNLLDISAAGHYQSGETMTDGIREVQEELGITVRFEDLIPLGVRVSVAKDRDVIDHQFNDVFILIYPHDIRDYHVQPDEVVGLVAFEINDGIALFKRKRDSIQAQAAGLGSDIVELRVTDFIPVIDNYMLKILLAARQCLNGDTDVYI